VRNTLPPREARDYEGAGNFRFAAAPGKHPAAFRNCPQGAGGPRIATEYLSLHGKDIRPCQACMKCAKDKNRVRQEDDFMPVFEAMAAADGLIVAPRSISAPPPQSHGASGPGRLRRPPGGQRLRPQGGQPHRGGPPGRGQFHLRQLQLWFCIMGMYVPGSSYWPIAYGLKPATPQPTPRASRPSPTWRRIWPGC